MNPTALSSIAALLAVAAAPAIAAGPDASAGSASLDHWAYHRIERPPVPEFSPSTTAGQSARNPVDAFLAAEHRRLGLERQPAAPRHVVLRRLYLDLVGLPPTPEQLADPNPYPEIVDRLLADPLHAERWARHWMDIWRYSDWDGLGDQLRNSQKHLWHWRDWIVDSLHADKGYDRMVLEMLAGDELDPANPDAVRATGFLARNYYLFNRTTWLDDTIEHTGKAFLAMTLNCAKCHDHKSDPVTMADYYRMRAVFEPHQVRLDPAPGVTDLERDGIPRVFDAHADAPTYLHLLGNPADADESVTFDAGAPAFLAAAAPPVTEVDLPRDAFAPALREHVRHDRLTGAKSKLAEARARRTREQTGPPGTAPEVAELAEVAVAAAEAELAALEATLAADRARVDGAEEETAAPLVATAARLQAEAALARAELAAAELAAAPEPDTAKLEAARKERDELAASLESVTPDGYRPLAAARMALESPVQTADDDPRIYPRTSTGRRLMLARWITSRDNPLAARVAVNHVWLRHFGEPLVANVTDFGRQTPEPELLGLLDYLAVELIESGWSLRHLHRLIVNSEAYRAGSSNAGASPDTIAADPGNRYFWRVNPRRMEAQVIRDSLLALAGTLDTTRGGPPVDPGEDSRRRSLYFRHSRDHREKFLSMFDDADHLRCYRRTESVVPQQALALANSKTALTSAAAIAAEVARDGASPGPDSDFVASAFSYVLGRPPSREECTECLRFWSELEALGGEDGAPAEPARVRTQLVLALLNHNDFVTIR